MITIRCSPRFSDAAPATIPNSPVIGFGTGLLTLSLPRYNSFNDSITKKRIAWFEPCFIIVAVRPWYVPRIPDSQQFHQLICMELYKHMHVLHTES